MLYWFAKGKWYCKHFIGWNNFETSVLVLGTHILQLFQKKFYVSAMEIDWGWNSMYHVVLENPHFELTLVECFNHTRQRALLFKKISQTWCKSQPWIITTAPFIEVLLFLFCMTGHHHGEWEEEGLLKETGKHNILYHLYLR